MFIEIRNENAYFFTEKINGTGGLPSGTQGKILAIIDVPKSILAAWSLMRRGCSIIFLRTNNQMEIYVDGVLKNTSIKTVSWQNISNRQLIGTVINNNDFFIGKIDEPRIYECALSASSIKFIYDNNST